MKLTRYVVLHDCGLNGSAIEPAVAYRTPAGAEVAVAELFAIALPELAGPARDMLATLDPDGTLIVNASATYEREALEALAGDLEARLGDRFLIIAGTSTVEAASGPAERREPVDPSVYDRTLLEWLRRLYRHHEPAHVRAVAELLAAGADFTALALEVSRADWSDLVIAEAAAALEARMTRGRPTEAAQ